VTAPNALVTTADCRGVVAIPGDAAHCIPELDLRSAACNVGDGTPAGGGDDEPSLGRKCSGGCSHENPSRMRCCCRQGEIEFYRGIDRVG